ncbi:MAG: histidine kinase [Ginsengibacter sp.]
MTDNIFILIVLIAAVLLQVRNQNKLLQKQKQLAAEEIKHQKDLLESIISSQEIERRRIGNDLHDEVGAILSALRMLIEMQNRQGVLTMQQEFINQSKRLIDIVIKKVRQISHNLSPHVIGNFWFYDAMIELSEVVNVTDSLRLTLDFEENEIPPDLDVNISLGLYRVITELVNNTIEHANANLITITFNTLNKIWQITYTDDGIGFNQKTPSTSRGMGFRNIESRLEMIHAKWNMQKEKTSGFACKVLVPLDNQH